MHSNFSYGTASVIPAITDNPAVDRGSDGLQNDSDLNSGEWSGQGQGGVENRCRLNAWQVDSVANTRNEIATASACQGSVVAGQASGTRVAARVVSHSVAPGVDRAATAPASPHGLQANDLQAATNQGSDRNAGLIYWLDRFLSIPVDRFTVPGEDVKERFANFDPRVAGIKWTVDKLCSLGSKRVLDSCVTAWLEKKQDRNQITRNLLGLQKDMPVEMTVYFRNWVLLKCYSDMLRGEPVSKTDRQYLVQALNQSVLNDFAELTNKASMMMDFYSLSLLYFMGGLPHFEDGVNYHKGITLLAYCPVLLREMYFFLSPVSFSPYDYVRFAPVSIKSLFVSQPNVPPKTWLGGAMQMMVMTYLQQQNDHLWGVKRYNCSRWFSDSELRSELYLLVKALIGECLSLTASMDTGRKKSCKRRVLEIDKKLQSAVNRLVPKEGNQDYEDIHTLATCLQARIHQCAHTASPMYSWKVANLYRKAAQMSPNHWSSAYIFFLKAHKWDLAANAAAEYARYYLKESPLLAEYWSDTSERARELVAFPETPRGQAAALDKDYDFDAVLRQFSEDVPKSAILSVGLARNKGRKRNGQRNESGNKSGRDAIQSPRAGGAERHEPLTVKAGQQEVSPVIRAVRSGKHSFAWPSADCQGFQVQSARGAIKPFEKLLSRNWNPIVLQTLRCIRAARVRSDITAERQIYQKLLNHPLLKTCIGIERIWEECAWTELHQFDDFFRSAVIPDAPMRQKARQWVLDARNKFILPSLMYCLEQDQIDPDINPEVIWNAVQAMLEQPEIASDPQVDVEIRFRLRCLFSSMGHTFSLWAMTDSSNADHHRQRAQTWYGYKKIDPGYVWTTGAG
ncbi:hypothetical protein [Endozoicomonas sp. YOMI1]|uniref:hypothetical protein n=1 Tax=Endozoicomonas sp. YOMI1 TaxID=2828739 RepID=UPI002147BA8B|nr:hypothetical protein [Endozoicomonas sp. YOMI1]